jgi:hypothetical protein
MRCRDGRYRYFSEFREGRVRPDTIELRYDAKDSVYRLTNDPFGKCWAVCSRGDVYLQIYRGGYVKLYQDKGLLRFYVPRSVPDMYALLCMEIVQHRSSNTASSGNFLGDMAYRTVAGALDEKRVNRATRNITANGLRNNFRYCTIDMDTGDILFSETPPR